MTAVCVIAAHPDDETLGCSGTLLNHKLKADEVTWIIVTDPSEDLGWSAQRICLRENEIDRVSEAYGFAGTIRLGFPSGSLEHVPRRTLVEAIRESLGSVSPEIIYFPWPGDIHSDHRVLGEAILSATKSFRNSFLRSLLSYETLSETNFSDRSLGEQFNPTWYVDISKQLTFKQEILKIYESELGDHPFPRSMRAIEALAVLRGSEMGVMAAEAFHVHRHFAFNF